MLPKLVCKVYNTHGSQAYFCSFLNNSWQFKFVSSSQSVHFQNKHSLTFSVLMFTLYSYHCSRRRNLIWKKKEQTQRETLPFAGICEFGQISLVTPLPYLQNGMILTLQVCGEIKLHKAGKVLATVQAVNKKQPSLIAMSNYFPISSKA